MTAAQRPLLIRADRVLTPGGVVSADLRVEQGRIVEIGDPPASGARVLDLRGLLVAPALVDMHGDAFERQLFPRPGVAFPLHAAIFDTDRQAAANGIATVYHALTLGWEPGLRSLEGARAFMDALAALAPRLAVEHRVQLRWETFCPEAEPLIAEALARAPTPSLAFNDHTSMTARPLGQPVQARAPDLDPARPSADLDDPAFLERLGYAARRAAMGPEALLPLFRERWARREAVPASVARMAALAREAGAPLLSHDDNTPALRAAYRAHGARIAEFPMTVETAEAARAAGDRIVLGAPNAARGGSHLGSVSAGEMVEAGLCDALASDYVYPAMLAAVARLVAERRCGLERAWALVSSNAAAASDLTDRGAIAPGLRADLVAAEWPGEATPTIRLTLSAGRIAHLSGVAI